MALLAGSCAFAHGAQGVSAGVAKPAKQSPNKRVCKKVKPTGSHLRQRVCMKKKEWDAMEKAARQTLRDTTVYDRGGVAQ